MKICDLRSMNSDQASRENLRKTRRSAGRFSSTTVRTPLAGRKFAVGSSTEETELLEMRSRMAGTVWLAVLLCCALSSTAHGKEQVLHEKTFYTPAFELGPGDVINRMMEVEFPPGHVAIRSLYAEVVDEDAVSVPLTEMYPHHWWVTNFYVKKGHKRLVSSVPRTLDVGARDIERIPFQEGADPLVATEQGCEEFKSKLKLGGAEDRHTNMTAPSPYGFVTGDPDAIPEGYEESWILNVHTINTVEAVDRIKCFECSCDSYGVTHNPSGKPLPEGYAGGLQCCYDKTHCAVKEGLQGTIKRYRFQYTITWVDWDESVVPLRIYRLDITDPRTSLTEEPHCNIEYTAPQCKPGLSVNKCVDHRHSIAALPVGGDLITAWLHQHPGGLGGVLRDQDGNVLCTSEPIYGQGDEAGYVVGMTSCYPQPGTVTVESMKELHFDAYYSNERQHTGVMSVFTLHVADPVTRIKEVTD